MVSESVKKKRKSKDNIQQCVTRIVQKWKSMVVYGIWSGVLVAGIMARDEKERGGGVVLI